ncbi:MAG: DoxX family protein [Chloroflexi bacterium]|nr:DoxX family protein [Chloroflexota bacterium]
MQLLDLGLFILRLVLGLGFVAHGSQKLFGWFGGGGLKGTAGMMNALGIRPASLWAIVAALSEFGGGLLLLLGFLNPIGSLGIMASMTIAIIRVHWTKGFWNSSGGFEFPLVNIAAALALALTGPGLYSLDAALGFSLPEPVSLIVGLILVILGVLAAEMSRATQPKAAPTGERTNA